MRRYLALGTETDTAWVPEWYPLIRAARYLHVAPWELLHQSAYWLQIANIAETAEAQAQEIVNRQGT